MKEGKVKFYNKEKGFGFITEDGSKKDIFVHANDLNGLEIHEGDAVTFETKDGKKGPCAFNVELV